MHLMAQDRSLVICHPRSCAFLLDSLLLFYFHLSFPVFFFSFHLLHCELYSELDNLIAMESLCYSAKGSGDAYDVSVSLTVSDSDENVMDLFEVLGVGLMNVYVLSFNTRWVENIIAMKQQPDEAIIDNSHYLQP